MLIGIQVASAASSVHQHVTVAKQDPGARPSGKRPHSLFPSCCAAVPYHHSAWRLRPKRAPPAWLVRAALIRLCSMMMRDLPLTLAHGQVHHWSQPCHSAFEPFSVAQALPSSPVALVPEASSATRGWEGSARHLPESYHAGLRCPEAGWRTVSVLQTGSLKGSVLGLWRASQSEAATFLVKP